MATPAPAYKTASFAQAISDRFYGGVSNNAAVVGGLTSLRAYNLVPWLFRAVAWRSEHVASMPFELVNVKSGENVTDDPVYASVVDGHRRRMFRTEAAKLLTGKAYWYKAANQFGRNVTPQWLLPGAITPREQLGVLTGFDYTGQDQQYPRQIGLERMVWFWNENFESDTQPGVGEAQVALAAASMLHALDAFTANFFNQGAVKVTVFPVPTGTPPDEVAKLENFLARRLSGVRVAFRNIVMRLVDKLQPIVIGSDVKDTQAVELTETQRENAAVALGVPPNVLSGNYKYATADSELVGYYMFTVIPEAEALFERANEQFYRPFGLELVAHPERTEIMQAVQLQQVSAVQAAVGKPVLLKHEGRELLGFAPEEQAEKEYDEKLAELGLTRKPEPVPPGMGQADEDEQDKPDEREEVPATRAVKSEGAHPGAMLAFMLDPNASALLGSIDDYKPDHLTLAFLTKDATTIDADQMAALVTVLKTFGRQCAPIVATIAGMGRFETEEGDGTNAVYASVDSPALPGFRETLMRLVRSVGIEPPANHGFIPHITLGYVDALLPTPEVALPVMPLHFGTLTLMAAGTRTDFPLTGAQVFKTIEANPEQVVKALAEWRRLALENVRGGGPYAVPSIIPARIAEPINAGLAGSKTAADVRTVFARHWPKAMKADEPTGAEVLAALREATAAARELAQ